MFNLEGIIFLFLDIFTLFVLTISFIFLIKANFKKEFDYRSQKSGYVAGVIAKIGGFIYILTSIMLINFLDYLSIFTPGAMCAVGVLNTQPYSNLMIFLRYYIIIFLLFFNFINKIDQEIVGFKYFRFKSAIYLIVFILAILDISLEIKFFINFEPNYLVNCCSITFKGTQTFFQKNIGIIFYFLTLFMVFMLLLKKRVLLFIATIFYPIVSYYAIIYHFSDYIYDQLSHHCPYCMLSKDYNYFGFYLYGVLIYLNYSIFCYLFSKADIDRIKSIFLIFLFFLILHISQIDF